MTNLVLYRSYLPESTIGVLFQEKNEVDLEFLCFTIELPWKDNARNVSCIPEGRYEATFENHPKHGDIYRLDEVPNRNGILIHSANSVKELRGCIAPVQLLTKENYGTGSRGSVKKIVEIADKQPVCLTIKKGTGG